MWELTILFGLTEIYCQGPAQNLCRRSRCCCRPFLVGDSSTRSSANSKHLTSDSSRVRPGAADCSSALANSLIDMLKRVGLKLPPCLTPLISIAVSGPQVPPEQQQQRPSVAQLKAQQVETTRRLVQEENEAEYQRALVSIKESVRAVDGPDLRETLQEQIRQWFIECR